MSSTNKEKPRSKVTNTKIKLPDALVTDEEWNALFDVLGDWNDGKNNEISGKLIGLIGQFSKAHGNPDKCLLCGADTKNSTISLCHHCRVSIIDRCSIRQVGRVRKGALAKEPCVVCGKKFYAAGLCRMCYVRKQRFLKKHQGENITPEELFEYLKERIIPDAPPDTPVKVSNKINISIH